MFMTRSSAQAQPLDADELARKGNPAEDAYAFLRAAVAEALAAGRFRPERQDPDLLAQTFWAGVHGMASLQIIMAHDAWIEWQPVGDRAAAMVDALLFGLVQEPVRAAAPQPAPAEAVRS
jgi:hypothetical protein